MGKVMALLGGLIAMAGGVVLVIFVWPQEFYELVFGCIPPFFSLVDSLPLSLESAASKIQREPKNWKKRQKKRRKKKKKKSKKKQSLSRPDYSLLRFFFFFKCSCLPSSLFLNPN